MIPTIFMSVAVACGNTFVAKPSEIAPLAVERLSELMDEVGFPPGVVAPVAQFSFGGMKDSFFGVLHGQKDFLNFFTDRKITITRWF